MNLNRARAIRALSLTVLILTFGGCGDSGDSGDSGGIGSSTSTDPDEVIIPATTKVLDPSSISALERVDENGTLYFNQSTRIIDSLQPGDVMVSDAGGIARYGLLKKILSVRIVGGRKIFETEDALITEAIHQGSGSVTRELRPEDISSTQILQAGVIFEGSGRQHSSSSTYSATSSSSGLKFTFDTDLGTGGQVKVTGTATINPIMDFGMNISCDRTIKTFLFGRVCAEIPDLNVLAKVGVKENANLKITAKYNLDVHKKYEIARHQFSPITFALGPVPVVLVPVLKVYLQGDGTLTANFSYEVKQDLTLAAGFKYNSDTGFKDLSEFVSNFSQIGPNFSGSLDVNALAGVQFEILVYGLIGPYGNLEGGSHLAANVSGLPGTGWLWNAEGCLRLNVGINSVKVLGIHYNKELWKSCVSFAHGENLPPSVSISNPSNGLTFTDGETIPLQGQAIDLDGIGTLSCRWTSSGGSDILSNSSCNGADIKLIGTGGRAISLIATDPSGQSGGASTIINVTAPPPASPISVSISSPVDKTNLRPGTSVTLTGSASGGNGIYTYNWSVFYPTDIYGFGDFEYPIGVGNNLAWTIPSLGPTGGYAKIVLTVSDSSAVQGSNKIVIGIWGVIL